MFSLVVQLASTKFKPERRCKESHVNGMYVKSCVMLQDRNRLLRVLTCSLQSYMSLTPIILSVEVAETLEHTNLA